MTVNEPTPISPDGPESLDLFSYITNLAMQAASRISDDEVEARLRRVQRKSGHNPPAAPDSEIPACDLAAAAQRLACDGLDTSAIATVAHLEARLRKAEQLLAGARQESATMTAIAQRIADAATSARAGAMRACAEAKEMLTAAIRLLEDAQSYKDTALDQAASIVADAKAAADDIRRARAPEENPMVQRYVEDPDFVALEQPLTQLSSPSALPELLVVVDMGAMSAPPIRNVATGLEWGGSWATKTVNAWRLEDSPPVAGRWIHSFRMPGSYRYKIRVAPRGMVVTYMAHTDVFPRDVPCPGILVPAEPAQELLVGQPFPAKPPGMVQSSRNWMPLRDFT